VRPIGMQPIGKEAAFHNCHSVVDRRSQNTNSLRPLRDQHRQQPRVNRATAIAISGGVMQPELERVVAFR